KDLGAEIVASTLEYGGMVGKFAGVRPIYAPPRQDTRQSDHVLLGIAAIGPERVQFHDLAREIFVESASVAAGARASGSCAQRIVEIDEHRRVLRHCKKQVTEPAQRKRTNRPLLVVADPQMIQILPGKDVEMVEPKVYHNLLQLAPTEHRPQNSCLGGLLDD